MNVTVLSIYGAAPYAPTCCLIYVSHILQNTAAIENSTVEVEAVGYRVVAVVD